MSTIKRTLGIVISLIMVCTSMFTVFAVSNDAAAAPERLCVAESGDPADHLDVEMSEDGEYFNCYACRRFCIKIEINEAVCDVFSTDPADHLDIEMSEDGEYFNCYACRRFYIKIDVSVDETTTEEDVSDDETTTEEDVSDDETTTEEDVSDDETTTEEDVSDDETTTEEDIYDDETTTDNDSTDDEDKIDSSDCHCICHHTNRVSRFVYDLVQFIRDLIGMRSVCNSCGIIHTARR
ncbi:MAG: hypothetical protein IKL47_02480 [Clostridia bacterium]|nr:hypothetical protein [Clostridia bacterium]